MALWEPCIFSLCLISIIDRCKVQSVHSIISSNHVFGEAELGFLGILKESMGDSLIRDPVPDYANLPAVRQSLLATSDNLSDLGRAADGTCD